MLFKLLVLAMLSTASGWGLPSNDSLLSSNESTNITDGVDTARDRRQLQNSCPISCDEWCDKDCDAWIFSCDFDCDEHCDEFGYWGAHGCDEWPWTGVGPIESRQNSGKTLNSGGWMKEVARGSGFGG